MINKLYYNTVNQLLLETLVKIMSAQEFKPFRLVGGTALSLQMGHRLSVDIDLFTDSEYGSVNFIAIDQFFKNNYSYVESNTIAIIGIGKSYFIGSHKGNCIKIDLYYTDNFIEPSLVIDEIRLATVNEIIAMKLDVILRGGRKKDFWDIHQIIGNYRPEEIFALHKKRHPFQHDKAALRKKFLDFEFANRDFDPNCLNGKHWELIKLDLADFIASMN
jgi:hypothetical protein